jgi:membrane protein YdbS with pleckstrin-like domain
MSHFPRELLADHEDIRFELSPHWLALVWPGFWTVVSLVILVVGSRIANGPHEDGTNQIASIGAALVFIVLAVIPFLQWKFTMFVLTSDRLITRTGIIAKHSKEIPLERINDVAFNQRIFERMVGAGDLLIESAGERGQEVISNVRHPEQVQLAIYKEAEENGNRMMRGGPASAPNPSIPEQIEALARLKAQGVLTDEEFDAKKQDLLKRL